MPDQLDPGQSLNPGQFLTSENGRFKFILQPDGDICLYQLQPPLPDPVWKSGTTGQGITILTMQADGNLVGRDSGGHDIWHTGTWGNEGAFLEVLDIGKVQVAKPLWSEPESQAHVRRRSA
jgi:hypothetical protein